MLLLKLLGIFYASALLTILAILALPKKGELPEGSSVGLSLLGLIGGVVGMGLYLALSRL